MSNVFKTASDLQSLLLSTGLVQPIKVETKNGISLLCRQVPGQEPNWLKVVQAMLFVADDNQFEILLARRYVAKEYPDGRKMVFGWHVQLFGKPKDIEAQVELLRPVLEEARPSLDPVPPPAPVLQPAPSPVQVQQPVQAPVAYVPPQAPQQQVLRPGERPFVITTVKKDFDPETKREIEILEFPLPNVSDDLNKPTQPVFNPKHNRYTGGGKGATSVSSG